MGLGLRLDRFALALAHEMDGNLHQVAGDLVDIAADITDLGEFGRFDLDKGRLGQLGQAARDLGFADTGRSDHEDVLRRHFLGEILVELLTPPAIAQGQGHGLLGIGLADDEPVEFGDNFARRKIGHNRSCLYRFDCHVIRQTLKDQT